MKYKQTPTPNKNMKIDYLYYDPYEEAIIECYKIINDQSWIKEITSGKTGLYEGDGFLRHFETANDRIIVHEIGPKENYPEYFL